MATARAAALVGALFLITVAAALLCAFTGVAWSLIGAFVLTGAALAAMRLIGLDPLGRFLESGELATAVTFEAPQGFGGVDVPADEPSSAVV